MHSEVFLTTADALFAMLVTPSAIRSWWGVARAIVIPEKGGMYALAWGDDEDRPDMISVGEVVAFEPGKLLEISNYRYLADFGKHPFSIEKMAVKYEIESDGKGTRLTVTNAGFPTDPIADEFYEGCIQGWQDTFTGIRNYLETTS